MSGLRWWLGALRRAAFPPKQEADWRRAQAEGRHAMALGQRVGGRRQMGRWHVEYPDVAALASQWEDLVVSHSLGWQPLVASPRILDAGANIGLASLVLKDIAPRARILAFEADPELAAMCRRNLERNLDPAAARDVRVDAVAVWTHDGEVAFAGEGADSGAVASLPGGPSAATRSVRCVRLRDVLATESVDLLKLDIEGAEADVLEDCRDVLGNVRAALVEVHDFHSDARRLPRVLQVLSDTGFLVALDHVLPVADREAPAMAGGFRLSRAFITRVKAWRP